MAGYNLAKQIDEPCHPLTPYGLAGGEPAVRKLADRFYDLMDEDPDFYGIRKVHPPTLDGLREKYSSSSWVGLAAHRYNDSAHIAYAHTNRRGKLSG